jgi:hypothetical protein
MSGKKPRKPRYQASHNTLYKAIMRATRYTEEEVQHLMEPINEALTALREGRATEMNWKYLVTAIGIGLSIEHKGVVRGLKEHLMAADNALATVALRCRATGQWRPTALWFDELDAIKLGVELYEYQVRQLSAKEYAAAYNHAIAEIVRTGGELAQAARTIQATLDNPARFEGATA